MIARSGTNRSWCPKGGFPGLPFWPVKLNWAIERNRVVDVHDHRVLRGRLTKFKIPPRRFIWGPGHGDSYDLAYLLGNVCAITSMHAPRPVAVTGDVDLLTNQVLGSGLIEDKREAALNDQMAHLILPLRTHLMPGDHLGVRYWPARDVNEAVFSLFSASCSDLAVPDLKRRWRVKMMFSWVSLLAASAGCRGIPVRCRPTGPILLGQPDTPTLDTRNRRRSVRRQFICNSPVLADGPLSAESGERRAPRGPPVSGD